MLHLSSHIVFIGCVNAWRSNYVWRCSCQFMDSGHRTCLFQCQLSSHCAVWWFCTLDFRSESMCKASL